MDIENDQAPVGDTMYLQPRNVSPTTLVSPHSSYAEVESPILQELPSPPVVYETLAADHTDMPADNTAREMTGGMIDNEPQTDSVISSNVRPSSAEETPYTVPESPAPAVYDRLTTHDYVNTDISRNEELADARSDEPQRDSGYPSYMSVLPETEATA